ncbi:phage major capsid protein [Microtetraspora niveoalba]|uniref:phage major capsid protein n=1 Tax=Microtetraspora niveoalba TaxID=46175 RepID=UPI000836E028|nr:phage major capsid protein [Microtetraspora niveoalba]
MTLREQLKAALARASELAKALAERDLTDEELEEVATLDGQVKDLRVKIAKADASQKMLKELADTDADAPDDDDEGVPRLKTADRTDRQMARSFGEEFTKSAAYKAFREAHPGGVGQGTPINIGRVKVGTMDDWFARRKATLDTTVARIQPIRMPMVDMVDRQALTILDLISRGQTGGNFEYVQVTEVTRNAAIVAEGALKPVSDMKTTIADAKVYTYADGYDVTNQLLADAPAFASYMNGELAYSLDYVVEDKLLNGTGTGGEPKGLLHTTGVQEVTYTPGSDAMEQVKAIRHAITKVTTLPGGQVTAVLMSPEDDEAWDLLQDTTDRFMGQGPFGSGPATSWGRPRALSQRLAPGTCILGDWRQIALLDREGLSVMAFNQHKDYAQKNMTYVRAELRAAQVIWKPNRLVVVKPAAGGGS